MANETTKLLVMVERDAHIANRLQEYTQKTGRSKSSVVREAVLIFLDKQAG